MADKSSQLLLTGLTRAAADTAGVPLHGNKTTPGLFPTTTPGKQAAQRCLDEGYLCSVSAERVLAPQRRAASPSEGAQANELLGDTHRDAGHPKGRTRTATVPLCTITDKGFDYLLGQVSPRQVLEDFVRVLESDARKSRSANVARPGLAHEDRPGSAALANRNGPR